MKEHEIQEDYDYLDLKAYRIARRSRIRIIKQFLFLMDPRLTEHDCFEMARRIYMATRDLVKNHDWTVNEAEQWILYGKTHVYPAPVGQVRAFEIALRDAGLSRSRAKRIINCGITNQPKPTNSI